MEWHRSYRNIVFSQEPFLLISSTLLREVGVGESGLRPHAVKKGNNFKNWDQSHMLVHRTFEELRHRFLKAVP
jgi:hypothetical protein